jgi:MFS family permease
MTVESSINEQQPLLDHGPNSDAVSTTSEAPKSMFHAAFDTSLLKQEFTFQEKHKRPRPLLLLLLVGIVAMSTIDATVELICRHHFPDKTSSQHLGVNNDPRCRTPAVASHYASFASNMMVISGLTGILTVPKITAFSDRLGRRPMFLIVLCGLLLSDVILFVCVQFPTEVDFRVLLFKAFAEGVGGGPALGAMRK